MTFERGDAYFKALGEGLHDLPVPGPHISLTMAAEALAAMLSVPQSPEVPPPSGVVELNEGEF